jgi:hypothetical protein
MIDVQVINLTVILRGRFEEEPKRNIRRRNPMKRIPKKL